MNLKDYNSILRSLKPTEIKSITDNNGESTYDYMNDLNIHFKYIHLEQEYGDVYPKTEQGFDDDWCPPINRNWQFKLEFWYSNTLIKNILCIHFDKCPKGILPFISYDYIPKGKHFGETPKFTIYQKDCDLFSDILEGDRKYKDEMVEQIKNKCDSEGIEFELINDFSNEFI